MGKAGEIMEMFDSVLICSIISGIIGSQIIQYIKKFKNNNFLFTIVSFSIGFLFALTFYKFDILISLWSGLFNIIGSEQIYQNFKGKFGLKSKED